MCKISDGLRSCICAAFAAHGWQWLGKFFGVVSHVGVLHTRVQTTVCSLVNSLAGGGTAVM
jgi:hypothetical protein